MIYTGIQINIEDIVFIGSYAIFNLDLRNFHRPYIEINNITS